MLNSIKKLIKTMFPGISWQNPVVNSLFIVIDPIDSLVRKVKRLPDMPSYSIRVRSNGVTGQFGGSQFIRNGNLIADILKETGKIKPTDSILEIGCGCGRTAISLASYLDDGCYTGVDIEKTSLDSCLKNKTLLSKNFNFESLDVYNAEFNPTGKYKGSEYQLPFSNESFNGVFLISVFTHMMPKDIENYIFEISRVLKDGGVCLISTFLMDRGVTGERISFPYQIENYYTNNLEMPEIAIGFKLGFYEEIIKKCNLILMTDPILGTWIETVGLEKGRFPQDILLLQKKTVSN